MAVPEGLYTDWEDEYVMDEFTALDISLEDNYGEKLERATKANITLKKQLEEYKNIESQLSTERIENQRLRYQLQRVTSDFTKLRSLGSSLECESSSEISNQVMAEIAAGSYGWDRGPNRTSSPSFEVIGRAHSSKPSMAPGHSGDGLGEDQRAPGTGESSHQHKVVTEKECSPAHRQQQSEISPSIVRPEQSKEPPDEDQQVCEHEEETASVSIPSETGDSHPHHPQKMRHFDLEIIDHQTVSVSPSQQQPPECQSQPEGGVSQCTVVNANPSKAGISPVRPPYVDYEAVSISARQRPNVVNRHIFVVPQALQEVTPIATATSELYPYGIGAKPKKPVVENRIISHAPNYHIDLETLTKNSDLQENGSKDQLLNKLKTSHEDPGLLHHPQQQTIPTGVKAHTSTCEAGALDIPKVMTGSAAKSDTNIFRTSSIASSALFGESGAPVVTSGQDTTTLPEKLQESSNSLIDLSEVNPAIVHPSDDQNQLASQAHSMASILEKNDKLPVGLSEQLFQFARDAAELEKKANAFQAMIIRQQAQTQRCCNADCQELRAENQKLLEQLNTLQGDRDKVSGLLKMSVKGETSSELQEELKDSEDWIKKVQNLEHINAKLFQANKDWYTKWEGLRQENQKEKDNLCACNNTLLEEMEKLRNDVTVMEKQLEEITTSKQQVVQRKFDLEQERLNLQRQYESVRVRLDNSTRDKRKLEAEVTALKSNFQRGQKGTHLAEDEDLKTENFLLQQQIKIYYEDFERERKDREKTVSKLEKLSKEKTEMEGHLQRVNIQKSKEITELRRKLAELTKQRKPQPQAQYALSQPVTCTAESESPIRPPNRPPGVHTYPLMTASQASSSHQISPEHLPGAWQCRICTYINYPSRSICDICGGFNQPDESAHQNTSGRLELKSRGELVRDTHDVVID